MPGNKKRFIHRPKDTRRRGTDAWFWTPEWQAGERQAQSDLEAGRVTRHSTAADFFRALEEGSQGKES